MMLSGEKRHTKRSVVLVFCCCDDLPEVVGEMLDPFPAAGGDVADRDIAEPETLDCAAPGFVHRVHLGERDEPGLLAERLAERGQLPEQYVIVVLDVLARHI